MEAVKAPQPTLESEVDTLPTLGLEQLESAESGVRMEIYAGWLMLDSEIEWL
jgi:hypothetical protein